MDDLDVNIVQIGAWDLIKTHCKIVALSGDAAQCSKKGFYFKLVAMIDARIVN